MTTDEQADTLRRDMIETGQPQRDLKAAKTRAEQTWTTAELQEQFTVVGFAAPYVVVIRKEDGVKGTLEFTHSPRVYFGWREDDS